MDNDLKEKLYKPFEVSIKPGQGYPYVKTNLVLDRMNEVFGVKWATTVLETKQIGEEILAHVRVSLLSDKGEVLAWQESHGSAKKFGKVEIGNLYRSSVSKAIKGALKNFGVALHLDDRNTTTAAPVTSSAASPMGGKPGGMVNMNLPNSNPSTTANPSTTGFNNTTPPQGFSGTETAPANGVPMSSPPVNTTFPSGNVPSGNIPSTPLDNTGPSSSFPQTQTTPSVSTEATAPTQTQGNLPPMGNVPIQQGVGPTASKPSNMGGEMDKAKITAIQKIVLTQKMTETNKPFKEFIVEEFAAVNHTLGYEVNEIDDLLYKDTLLIVAN